MATLLPHPTTKVEKRRWLTTQDAAAASVFTLAACQRGIHLVRRVPSVEVGSGGDQETHDLSMAVHDGN